MKKWGFTDELLLKVVTSRRIMAAASTPALSGESADIVRRDRDAREVRRRG
ncbi:MAG: hypothetical protein KJS95_01580 [Gammaproteobacteria bacterium]|jgi:hypothetical protein|nr:hypothetical protein [Gammaproteobacteria bacterium]